MIELHTEILKKSGRKEFAVIPFEEYEALMDYIDDLEDIADLRKLKKKFSEEGTISIEEAKKEVGV